jgi:putative MFS transporter
VILSLILLLFWLVRLPMDETPKYLALRGKFDQARAVIERIAKKNGHPPSTLSFTSPQLIVKPANSEPALSRLDQIKRLFRPPYLRTTLFLSPVWFLVSFAYVISSMFMPELLKRVGHGSESDRVTYMTMFVQQIAGIPGILLATWMVETRLGRRWTLSIALVLSGLCVFLFLIAMDYWMVLGASTLMLFFSLMAYSAQYTITPESYPTAIRSTGMGWCSAMSRTAGVITPAVAGLLFSLKGGTEIVLVVCVAFFAVAGVLAAFLRETRGRIIDDDEQ